MRSLVFIIIVLITAPFSHSYSQVCKPGQLCRIVIPDSLGAEKRQLLKDNWNDFFAVDLESQFPILPGRTLNIASIRLDGLGCIYPIFINDGTYRNEFLDETRKQKQYDKLSFYSLFSKRNNLLDGQLPAADVNTIKAIYNNGDSSYASKYYAFQKIWNEKFLQAKIDELNQTIDRKKIKKVFLFIHGFNVPYSLAHLQGNAFFRKILEDKSLNPEETLFVRVFWPAMSEKRSDFMDDDNCDITNRKLRVFKSKLFSYVSNRGYLCGYTLNGILSNLPDNIQYNIISHSFGSALSAAILFSPKSKINKNHWDSEYNSRLLALFENKPTLKEKEINFFMHAAGMPGQSTFTYLSAENNAKHTFYLGFNKLDEILLKKVWIFKSPAKKSSTTLGCNWKGSADSVVAYGASKGLAKNFIAASTSTISEHDIFCYMQQPQFKTFFTNFVNDVLR